MINMNKIVNKQVAIIMTLTLLLTGCGAGNQEEKSNSTLSNSSYSSYLNNEIPIDFECIWVGGDSKAEYVASMIDSFNKEYEGKYHVNVIEQTDYNTYESKLKVQIGAGQVPDIFTVKNYSEVQEYAQTGKLMDFSNFMSNQERQSRFTEGVLEEYKNESQMNCIPYETGAVPIMYNMEVLQSVGIEEAPTTWEEFFEICDLMKENGMTPTSFMTGANAWTAQLWYSYAVASTVGKDAWNGDMTGDDYIKAAEIVKHIYEYAPSDAIGAEAGAVNNHFYNKETAIYTNGAWILGGMKKNAGDDFCKNIKISSGMSYEDKNANSFISYIQAFLCAAKQENPDKQEAVEAFIDYITDIERVTELSESSGATFCLNVDEAKLTNPLQADIISKCNKADFTIKGFGSAVSPTMASAFPENLEKYVTGGCSAKEFLQAVQNAQ